MLSAYHSQAYRHFRYIDLSWVTQPVLGACTKQMQYEKKFFDEKQRWVEMLKKDWNKLVMSTIMQDYVPTSLWCVTQQHITVRPIVLLVVGSSGLLLCHTSKWSRDINVYCGRHHNLISVLFQHPYLTLFFLNNFSHTFLHSFSKN